MSALAQILPGDPNIKPLWLPFVPPQAHGPRAWRAVVALLRGKRPGKIVFAPAIRDDDCMATGQLRSIKPGGKVYLQAWFQPPISSEEHLTLRVSRKGEKGQPDQILEERAIPTLDEIWTMGHVTPDGERIFPRGPVPAERDTNTVVLFSKPTAPLPAGNYHFSLANATGEVLSAGNLAVADPVLIRVKKP